MSTAKMVCCFIWILPALWGCVGGGEEAARGRLPQLIDTSHLDLLTEYQNSYPKYIPTEEGIGGLCVEIMRLVERESGLRIGAAAEELTSFKRLQLHLRNGDIDIFFGFKRDEFRADQYVFIDPPIYQVNSVVAVLADDDAVVRSIQDLGGMTVLVPLGSATAKKLKTEYPAIQVDEGGDIFSCLRKLRRKRGRFVFYHDIGVVGAIREMGLGEQIRILPGSFDRYYHHVALAPGVSAETRERVKRAVERLAADGRLDEISNRYRRF